MAHRRWVAGVTALALTAACSQGTARETIGAPDQTTTSVTVAERPEIDVVYVQHALFGTTATDDTGSTLTLAGVDQVTTWTTTDAAGTMTTADFISSWSDLGLDAVNPQAAFVPADPDLSPVVVELSDPAWDADRRTITYRVRTVSEPESRLAGMVSDPGATLPEAFDVASLVISQPDAPDLPEGSVTTTTTTVPPETVPAETVPPETGAPPSSPSTPSSSGVLPSSPPPPPSPQPQPEPPPVGPAQMTFTPTSLEFPVSGGQRTLVITNVGAGVGSWSLSPEIGTGISASPVGGYLFPGSSITVTLVFNGQGPARDFRTTIELLTSNGLYLIPTVVG